jgi:hypothetical protein
MFLHYVLQYIYLPFYVSLPSFPVFILFLPHFFASWFSPDYAFSYLHSIHFCFEVRESGWLKDNIRSYASCELPQNSNQMPDARWPLAQLGCSSEGKTIKIKKRTYEITPAIHG